MDDEKFINIMTESSILAFLLSIPMGAIGGLTYIWFSPEIGGNIAASSFVIGVCGLLLMIVMLGLFEDPEESGKDDSEE